MTDKEIIKGLIEKDNRVTKEFFFENCRPEYRYNKKQTPCSAKDRAFPIKSCLRLVSTRIINRFCAVREQNKWRVLFYNDLERSHDFRALGAEELQNVAINDAYGCGC